MNLGMETMIIVALVMYVLTTAVSIGLLVWYMKAFGPIMKVVLKQYKRMYSELEEEEVELQRVK